MGKFLLPGEADRLCEAFVLGNGFVNCFPRAWSRACYTGQVLREFWEGREGGGREPSHPLFLPPPLEGGVGMGENPASSSGLP